MIHLSISLLATIIAGAAFVVNTINGRIYWAFIGLILAILNLGLFCKILEPMLK